MRVLPLAEAKAQLSQIVAYLQTADDKDVDGLPNDLDGISLKAGLADKAKMSLKGKGVNIPMPALGAFNLPLTTQLQSENGQCYEATMATPSVNTTALFKANGD